MPRKTNVFNMKVVPSGFVDHNGRFLGTITPSKHAGPCRYYAVPYVKNEPQRVQGLIDYNEAKQYLIDNSKGV